MLSFVNPLFRDQGQFSMLFDGIFKNRRLFSLLKTREIKRRRISREISIFDVKSWTPIRGYIVSNLSYPKIERDIRYNCEEANRETDLSLGEKERERGEKKSGPWARNMVALLVMVSVRIRLPLGLRRKSLNKEMIAGASAPFVAGVSRHGSWSSGSIAGRPACITSTLTFVRPSFFFYLGLEDSPGGVSCHSW